MKRILIFGASEGGRKAFKRLVSSCEVIGFADNDKRKQGKRVFGRRVFSAQEAIQQPHDSIVIASMHADAIFTQLTQLGVSAERIDLFDQDLLRGRAAFPRGIRNLLLVVIAIVAFATWRLAG